MLAKNPSGIPPAPHSTSVDRLRALEEAVNETESFVENLLLKHNPDPAPITTQAPSDKSTTLAYGQIQIPQTSFQDFADFHNRKKAARKNAKHGTKLVGIYNPFTLLSNPPSADEVTLPMLLANQTHLGHHTSLWNPANSSYIFGVREGIHIISLDITYAYLKRAAKIVHEVAFRGGIILFVGTRRGQTDLVVRSAKRAEGYHIFDRWVPGTLTNGQQLLGKCAVKAVDILDEELVQYSQSLSDGDQTAIRPDLVICLNAPENEVCLHECGLFTIPTIGIVDTDVNPSWVTYPIPANDDSHRSVALIAGVLSRAAEDGQRLRRQEALKGTATYDTRRATRYLKDVEVIADMDAANAKSGAEKRDRDRA
jgi:small subunit ribosomal protein S2